MPPAQPQLPVYHWHDIHPNAALHYVRDLFTCQSLLDTLSGPVGFDLEWKPTFTKNTPENPVAIVQLANATTILVIQISQMNEFPTKLREFLENPDIVKAGVAIQSQHATLVVSAVSANVSLVRRCQEDIQRLSDNARWKGKYSAPLGLSRLVETYESLSLPKGRVSRSNWESRLTPREIDYAANDAHAGFVLYQRLSIMANAMDKVPKSTYYSFDFVRGNFCEPSGMHWNCHNPDYDPGPPPPPKEPKPPTARDLRRARARAIATSNASLHAVSQPSSDLSQLHLTPRLPDSIQQATERRISAVTNPQATLVLSQLHPTSRTPRYIQQATERMIGAGTAPPPISNPSQLHSRPRLPISIQQATERRISAVTTCSQQSPSSSEPMPAGRIPSDPFSLHREQCPNPLDGTDLSCEDNIRVHMPFSPSQQDTFVTPNPKRRRRRVKKPVSAS